MQIKVLVCVLCKYEYPNSFMLSENFVSKSGKFSYSSYAASYANLNDEIPETHKFHGSFAKYLQMDKNAEMIFVKL